MRREGGGGVRCDRNRVQVFEPYISEFIGLLYRSARQLDDSPAFCFSNAWSDDSRCERVTGFKLSVNTSAYFHTSALMLIQVYMAAYTEPTN